MGVKIGGNGNGNDLMGVGREWEQENHSRISLIHGRIKIFRHHRLHNYIQLRRPTLQGRTQVSKIKGTHHLCLPPSPFSLPSFLLSLLLSLSRGLHPLEQAGSAMRSPIAGPGRAWSSNGFKAFCGKK